MLNAFLKTSNYFEVNTRIWLVQNRTTASSQG
uniref:Uncharacterized protein n=1 Tax=Anguilla anguilla TaxID=7936 RepID=A0A0E9UIV2_ANGAN